MEPGNGLDKRKLFDLVFQHFNPNTLYEGIVCSKYIGSDYTNAACMGFRINEEGAVVLNPYFNTDTIKNLAIGTLFSLNISDDSLSYAKAALTGWGKGAFEPEFDMADYNNDGETKFPYLKTANIVIIARVTEIKPYLMNEVPTGNKIYSEIEELIIKTTPKNYCSREFPLILEALISATRAKAAKDREEEPEKLFHYSVISDVFVKLKRFSVDEKIKGTIEFIKKWVCETVEQEFLDWLS